MRKKGRKMKEEKIVRKVKEKRKRKKKEERKQKGTAYEVRSW